VTDQIRIKLNLDGVPQVQAGANAAATAIGKVGDAAAKVGTGGPGIAQIGAQFQDFFIQVQGGQPILTALLQQGSQLSSMQGGLSGSLRTLTSAITPTIAAIGGLAAGAGALALAYQQGAAENDAYARSLILSGNAAGTTTGQLKELAKAQDAVVGTQAKAAEALALLASTGQVSAGSLAKAADAAIRFERAGGAAVEATAKKFEDLGRAPLSALVRLNEAENFLTRAVYDQVRALELQHKTTEAAAVAQAAYADALKTRAADLESQLGGIERGWRLIKSAASDAWDAMLGIGRKVSLEEQLAAAEKALADAPAARRGTDPTRADARREAMRARVEELRQQIYMEREAASAQQAAADATKKHIEGVGRALDVQAAHAQAAYAAMSATIRGEIDAIQSKAKRGLLSPIEAIEQTGAKNVALLKAEQAAIGASIKLAQSKMDSDAQVASLQGQYHAKAIEIGNAEKAVQYQVAEAIYARKRAAEEAYRVEAADGQAAIDALNVQFARAYSSARDAVRDYAQAIDDANAMLELEARMIGATDQARGVALEKLRVEIALRKELERINRTEGLSFEQRETLSAEARAAAARASAAAVTRVYLDEWKKTNDQIGQSLTDALMEGGKSAADYLKGYFRTLILRPIIQAVVAPVSGAIASFVTGGASGGGASAAAAGLNNANTLVSLYQAGTGYSSGVNALASYLGAGTTAGASGVSLGYANAVGAAGGDSLGALIASNGSWAGVGTSASSLAASESATLFASQAAGEGITVAGGQAASGAGASAGASAWTLYAAAFVAAWMGSRSAWEAGYNNENLTGAFRYSPESTFTDLLKIGGMSDRAANIWGGGAVYTKLFGRASPRVTDTGVQGTIGGGQFSGEAYADILEKGGWFRSDKRRTDTQAVPESVDMFLDDAAAAILKEAKKYGEALGLPAEQLAGITTDIRVSLGDDAEKNKTAITEALGKYGDALMGGYEAAIKPLQRYGETVTQTIQRVGGALLGVNNVLEQLGANTLASSVTGAGSAIDLAARFGDKDGSVSNLTSAASAFYDAFYTEQEKVDRLTGQLTKTFTQLGLTMPSVADGADTARDAYRDLVTGQDLATESGRAAFTALIALGGAFDQVAQRSENLRAGLNTAIDRALPKFQTPAERTTSAYAAISGDLQGVGLTFSVEQLMGASKEDIEAFARSVVAVGTNSIEMKTAVVQAAGALADLKDDAAEAAAALADRQLDLQIELQRALGNEAAATALEHQRELEALRLLNPALAQTKQFIYEAIDAANSAARWQNVSGRVDSVASQFLEGAELTGYLSGRISEVLATGGLDVSASNILGATKADVLALFQAVGIDGKEAILDALPLWDQLQEAIHGTDDELARFAADLTKFTGSLKSSDLSPLSQEAQLAAAQAQYDTTLAKAKAGDETARGDLTNVAQTLLQEAQGAYASSGAYAAIFDKVIGDLDALALSTVGGAAAAAASKPGDVTFVDGPAGSSGGLSGAPKTGGGQVIDLTPLLTVTTTGTDRQVELLQQQVAELRAQNAELKRQTTVLNAIAGIGQAGHAQSIAALHGVKSALGEGAQQQRLTARETARA
jgi:hypothetical protein